LAKLSEFLYLLGLDGEAEVERIRGIRVNISIENRSFVGQD
jgi:hypothetical protein